MLAKLEITDELQEVARQTGVEVALGFIWIMDMKTHWDIAALYRDSQEGR